MDYQQHKERCENKHQNKNFFDLNYLPDENEESYREITKSLSKSTMEINELSVSSSKTSYLNYEEEKEEGTEKCSGNDNKNEVYNENKECTHNRTSTSDNDDDGDDNHGESGLVIGDTNSQNDNNDLGPVEFHELPLRKIVNLVLRLRKQYNDRPDIITKEINKISPYFTDNYPFLTGILTEKNLGIAELRQLKLLIEARENVISGKETMESATIRYGKSAFDLYANENIPNK